MGFSLGRALAAGIAGGAHAAGEVYDAQLKEAVADRTRISEEESKFRQLDHADELLAAREARIDEMKAVRAEKEQGKLSIQLKEVRDATRALGKDPDTYEGMKVAAGLADEKGYTSIADKWRLRLENERSHMANEANRKESAAFRSEAARARREDKMGEEEKAAMGSVLRIADRLTIPGARDENGKVIGDKDPSAANAAAAWAESERDKKRSWKSIKSDLVQITDGFFKQPESAKKLDPATRFNAALKFYQMSDEDRKKLSAGGGASGGAAAKKVETEYESRQPGGSKYIPGILNTPSRTGNQGDQTLDQPRDVEWGD